MGCEARLHIANSWSLVGKQLEALRLKGAMHFIGNMQVHAIPVLKGRRFTTLK
jgi:hypothetical protein